jgi:hypothetical protein
MNTVAKATDHFVEKWFRREPEMRIAAAFCARADAPPANGRETEAKLRFEAWGALLHELREALFELPDAGVAAAKRGWWAEELQLISQGKPRHPLGEALASYVEAKQAPWTGLSLALVGGGGDARAADTAQALAALQPLARSTLAVEDALFATRSEPATADALAVHWLLHRLPRGLGDEDAARVPMHLLARHGLTAASLPSAADPFLRDWAGELLARLPVHGGGAFLRRARTRFDRARLQRLRAKGGQGGFDDPGAPGTLWRAWRAARGR